MINNINNIKENEAFSVKCLLKAISIAVAKNGNEYTHIEIADKSGTIGGNLWAATDLNVYHVGDIIEVSGRGSVYNGKMTMNVSSIKKTSVTDEELAEILPSSPYGVGSMWNAIENLIGGIKNDDIRNLTSAMVHEVKDQFIKVSGSRTFHHSGVHGLLQHTAEMGKTAAAIAPIYPVVNKDLLVAGTILHDLAKIEEYVYDSNGLATDLSVDGILFGHLFLGAEKIRLRGKELGISEDVIRALSHMVACHHGKQEWGAIQKPCSPEAMALFLIDMLSARMEMFRVEYENLQPGQISDSKNMGMDGIRVFRPNV